MNWQQKVLGLTLVSASAIGFSAPAFAALNDAQIAKIVWTANQGEIATSKMAESMSSNAAVKSFAADMIKAHTQNDSDLTAVLKKDNIKPEDSPAAMKMKAEADQVAMELKKLKGADFDKAYVDAQAKMHGEVLNGIDTELLPAVKNADLKAHIDKTRPAVVQHMEHVKGLQASMMKPMAH